MRYAGKELSGKQNGKILHVLWRKLQFYMYFILKMNAWFVPLQKHF